MSMYDTFMGFFPGIGIGNAFIYLFVFIYWIYLFIYQCIFIVVPTSL